MPSQLPDSFLRACRRAGIRPTRFVLAASVRDQAMRFFQSAPCARESMRFPYKLRRSYRISTSRFGIGQIKGSNQTPLGLHRISAKIGAGHPIGTVFQARRPVGFTWQGFPSAPIAHRILWLEGLEDGLNRGGNVDSRERYIYIHGVGDENTMGKPASSGCLHLAAADLLHLFDLLPTGTLVWVTA